MARTGNSDDVRNLFDQYGKPENRVTHALAHTLLSDRRLIPEFVTWATGQQVGTQASVRVQYAEGEKEGIPDIVFDNDSTCLAVENKLYPRAVETDQLRRHWNKVGEKGKPTCGVLVISPDPQEPPAVARLRGEGANAYWREWQAVYTWVKQQTDVMSGSRGHALMQAFCEYLRVVETQLQDKEANVILTPFEGIHFKGDALAEEHPLIKVKQIRKQIEASEKVIGFFPGRSAKLGSLKDGPEPWTIIGIVSANAEHKEQKDAFNNHPHLTIGIDENWLAAHITLPNAADAQYKRRAFRAKPEDWQKVMSSVQQGAAKIGLEGGPLPFVKILQRHYVGMKFATTDGVLDFSLDTLDAAGKADEKTKTNPLWFSIVPQLVGQAKHVNIQVEVGLRYPYKRCKTLLGSPDFPDRLVEHLGVLLPFFDLLTKDV